MRVARTHLLTISIYTRYKYLNIDCSTEKSRKSTGKEPSEQNKLDGVMVK